MKSGEAFWRVFYTRPRAEKRCEACLAECGVDVYLPKRKVVRQWRDRRKKVSVPLFPNYIFARVNESDRIRVLKVNGIARCLAFGGKLARLAPKEIEQLRILEKYPHRLEAVEGPLPALGERVEIKSGPMRGIRGEVVEVRGKRRLVIYVTSIRRSFALDTPTADVVAI